MNNRAVAIPDPPIAAPPKQYVKINTRKSEVGQNKAVIVESTMSGDQLAKIVVSGKLHTGPDPPGLAPIDNVLFMTKNEARAAGFSNENKEVRSGVYEINVVPTASDEAIAPPAEPSAPPNAADAEQNAAEVAADPDAPRAPEQLQGALETLEAAQTKGESSVDVARAGENLAKAAESVAGSENQPPEAQEIAMQVAGSAAVTAAEATQTSSPSDKPEAASAAAGAAGAAAGSVEMAESPKPETQAAVTNAAAEALATAAQNGALPETVEPAAGAVESAAAEVASQAPESAPAQQQNVAIATRAVQIANANRKRRTATNMAAQFKQGLNAKKQKQNAAATKLQTQFRATQAARAAVPPPPAQQSTQAQVAANMKQISELAAQNAKLDPESVPGSITAAAEGGSNALPQ